MDETQMIGDASAAADAWLERLDAGDVEATWERTSSLFRQLVDLSKWTQSFEQVTALFGRPLERELATSEYLESVPGAPDGNYVVLTYTTAFERKKEAIETVVAALDDDGEWRVGGYFVR
ncbi:MAG TPA: DUF4019 domain-containing protein [Longimicrobium sp.]